MDGEEDRNEPPEFLPIRRESIEEESDAGLASSPESAQVPMPGAGPSNEPAASEAGIAPAEAVPRGSAWNVGESDAPDQPATGSPIPPMQIVDEQARDEIPASPTEPSHHFQLPLPDDLGAGELDPGDGISRIFGPPAPGQVRIRMPLSSGSSSGAPSDRERLVPSIMVTVMLGHSRDMFEQAVEAAIERATQKFHKIVKQEIDLFAFEQRAARRAADHRLRGPNPQ